MSEAKQAVQVVETVYRALEESAATWLGEIRAAALVAFGVEGGTVGEVFVDHEARMEVRRVADDPHGYALHQALFAAAGLPPEDRLEVMMTTVLAMFPEPARRVLFLRGPVSRLRRAYPDRPPWMSAIDERFRMADVTNVLGLDATGGGVVMSLAIPPKRRIPGERALAHVAAHLAAAHRLRRRAAPTEAVFDRGKLVHAEGPAREVEARAALREAALRVDRARTAGRSEGIELWTALVEGRWSLVEQFDDDGRRFVVAKRNECPPRVDRRLTAAESSIVGLFALGHAQKFIAYELGLPESAVSTRLRAALRKLGVRNRQMLIELYGALRGATPSEGERGEAA